MKEDEVTALHTFIEGHVQGVGFRYFVLEQANNLGVTGWVRNTFRDEVEVLAEGNRTALEELLIKLQRGPSSAYVTTLRTEWQPASGRFTGFRIASTH